MRRQTSVKVGSKVVKLSREHLYALRQDLDSIAGVEHTDEICYCECHNGKFSHTHPCCRTCGICGKNILIEALEAHQNRHQTTD